MLGTGVPILQQKNTKSNVDSELKKYRFIPKHIC